MSSSSIGVSVRTAFQMTTGITDVVFLGKSLARNLNSRGRHYDRRRDFRDGASSELRAHGATGPSVSDLQEIALFQ